jgi:hypothetical protein
LDELLGAGAKTGPWFTEPSDVVVGLLIGSVAVPYGDIIDPPTCNGEGVGPGIVIETGSRVGRRDGLFVGELVTGLIVVGASVVGAAVMTSGDNDGDGVLKFALIVGCAVGTSSDGETVGSIVCLANGTSVCGDSDGETVGAKGVVASKVLTDSATFLNLSKSSAFK